MIAVLPRSNLAAVVELMQGSSRVAGMMVAEDFDPGQLSAVATRILTGDLFGLEKVMPAGTQIHARVVGDHREKSLCMAQISELVEQAGVPRKYRAPIEQCIDEMLMNALYDAPVDAHGHHIFAGIPTKVADHAAHRAERRRAVRLRRQAVRRLGARRVRRRSSGRPSCATCTRASTPSSRSIARPAARASACT